MTIVFLGIDLAKNVFALHGVHQAGRAALVRPLVRRDQLLEAIAKLPPCTIGMEACSGAHHWARWFVRFGHTVRLMAPKFVAPYRMSGRRGKNDAADAEPGHRQSCGLAVPGEGPGHCARRALQGAAICEALQRRAMRFVPVKSELAQCRLAVHTVREGWVKARTATINRLRGLLSEFGVVLPLKAQTVRRAAAEHIDALPGWMTTACLDLLDELHRLDERVAQYDAHIQMMARADKRSKVLMEVPGIGSTTASALVASIGNGHDFRNGRQLAAWLGLVPGQYSSGGKQRLGRITKAGNAYLRTLLIQGAKAAVRTSEKRSDRLSQWITQLKARVGWQKAVVALANKNARILWAILTRGERFDANHLSDKPEPARQLTPTPPCPA